jgi:tetratricopeptide (TPR) repeat protein
MSLSKAARCSLALFGLLLASGVALAEGEPASMEGRLLDAAGEPVADLEITLLPTDYRGERTFAATDTDGRFRFPEIKPADYRVRFRGTDREVRILDAMAVDDGGEVSWEISAAYDVGDAPELSVGAGEEIRYEAVIAAPGEDVGVGPDNYRGTLDRLTELVYQGKCAEAAPQLDAHLHSFPHRAKGHYLLGYCSATTGNIDGGTASIRRALELNPSMPGAALLLAQIYMQIGKPDEAAPWFKSEADNGTDPNLRVQALTALGYLERDRGNTDEAAAAFTQITELQPERPEAWAELADLHAKSGDADGLVEVLTRAKGHGGIDLGPLLNLVIAHMNDKEYDRARELLAHAMELSAGDEDRAMVHALVGRCKLGQSGELQGAASKSLRSEGVSSLRKSLELDGDGRFAAQCRKILDDLEG